MVTVAAPDTSVLAPTRERIDALDVIRGVAILGILLMNIESMGMPLSADAYPPMMGWSRADQIVWWIHDVLARGTMRGLLSLLFGAGFIMMTTRTRADAGQIADVYHRRNIWLVLFGLMHGYAILWPGDILLIYGLAGLFLFPWRHWLPRRLVIAGATVLGLLVLFGAVQYRNGLQLSREAAAAASRERAGATLTSTEESALERWHTRETRGRPKPDQVRRETEARLGGFASNWHFEYHWANELNEPVGFFYWTLDAVALMFIGAALVKWGVIQGRRSTRFYIAMAMIGYGIGVPLNVAEAWPVWISEFQAPLVWAGVTHQISRTAVTFGHLGLLHVILATAAGRWAMRPFAATGRLALSNYIGQTIICQWILFPGFGLALFGRFSMSEIWALVGGIALFQMVVSMAYLRRFQMGPLEWGLRTLAYGNVRA